ncbi:MAG: ferrous iron transport protein B [Candidatus Hydrogenedentota bacterium]
MARIAISGNPNAGKTSIFNQLTGTLQQVSNYPGVTVERKEGVVYLRGVRSAVVDLPGTYSLTAYSREEIVARNVIIDDNPDLVIDVVDAANLERNLYLLIQIMEMQVPIVVALNMADIARKRGYVIDADRLGALLGVPVIPTVGSRGEGLDALREACAQVIAGERSAQPKPVTYGHEVNAEVDRLEQAFAQVPELVARFNPRWVAVKALEGDEELMAQVQVRSGTHWPRLEKTRREAVAAVESHFNDEPATIIAERRYGFAAGAVMNSVTLTGEARQDMTDRIDSIVCNRFVGPVAMVCVVAALFFTVFKLTDEWAWIPWFGGWVSPTGWMEWLFDRLSGTIAGLEAHAPMLHSLLDDGIIGGVGGVMSFVPLIFVMFMFISALEDTGYIARVAFILDRVLQTFGLQGKSMLSMIVSGGLGAGGCAVPGVMATRTLREEKDRLVTMLVTPFMNCGAKMTVYAMLIAAFFAHHKTEMMMLLWAISWVVALCAAWVLRKFVIRGDQTPFVMELPPYHMPVVRGVLRHTTERTWLYIKKAGTVILAINIVLWAMMYFPHPPGEGTATVPATAETDIEAHQTDINDAERLHYSAAGRLGRTLEPLSKWAGFDWRTNIALIGGFAAKEVIVGTLGTAYSMGDMEVDGSESLPKRLQQAPDWSPLKAFVLMVFVMIYAPCFVTMAVIRRESGSWKWAIFSTVYSTAIAYVLAVLVFQGGRLLGIGG